MKATGERIKLLGERDFWRTYRPLAQAIENPSKALEQQISDEHRKLGDSLERALAKRWNNRPRKAGFIGLDYELADDWNICWHHCMGIYSERIHCSEFLDVVQQTLARFSNPWCFHVACECETLGYGGIFFAQGKIYCNSDKPLDYRQFLKSGKKSSTLLRRIVSHLRPHVTL